MASIGQLADFSASEHWYPAGRLLPEISLLGCFQHPRCYQEWRTQMYALSKKRNNREVKSVYLSPSWSESTFPCLFRCTHVHMPTEIYRYAIYLQKYISLKKIPPQNQSFWFWKQKLLPGLRQWHLTIKVQNLDIFRILRMLWVTVLLQRLCSIKHFIHTVVLTIS